WHVQASYVGSRGNHLLRRFETNLFAVPVVQPDGSLFFPKNSGPINPTFSSISVLNTDAQSFYHALQISANQSIRKGLSIQATYTFSKSVDDSSSSNAAGQYPLMRTLERGLSDFDIRHRLVFNYFYTLPVGGGQRWWSTGMTSKFFGGWRVG